MIAGLAATRNLKPFQWKLGQTGNAGGTQRVDLAAQAVAIFENAAAIYAAYAKMPRKGSPGVHFSYSRNDVVEGTEGK